MSDELQTSLERTEKSKDNEHRSRGKLSDRERSDENEDRRRNHPPARNESREKPRRKDAGFKWKKSRRDDTESGDRDEGLRRGYRDQYRPRSRSRSRSPRRPDRRRDEYRERRRNDEIPGDIKVKKDKTSAPAVPQQEMIIVYVNDRLGTKKAIPCFPTDPIKDFKVIVASMIGRQPHEILLKRQGERPFKDMLTLQDYGVSNNVQLDLEVDTGD